ncbi:zinc metalloprotease [Priestia megaterium]|uniref:hypothetical protein n=1 Tax=Priestia megaterium TaxID=1404 RepID=UPI00386CD01C
MFHEDGHAFNGAYCRKRRHRIELYTNNEGVSCDCHLHGIPWMAAARHYCLSGYPFSSAMAYLFFYLLIHHHYDCFLRVRKCCCY